MELLGTYQEHDEAPEDVPSQSSSVPLKKFELAVSAAPLVKENVSTAMSRFVGRDTKEVFHNPKAEEMWAPIQGPFNPNGTTLLGKEQGVVQNCVTGFVEPTEFNPQTFDNEYKTFMRFGYAHAPDTGELVGNQANIVRFQGRTMLSAVPIPLSEDQKQKRTKRKEISGDVTKVDTYLGPWGSYLYEAPEEPQVATPEQLAHAAAIEAKKKREKNEDEPVESVTESSEYHGTGPLQDYQGRTYKDPPSGLKPPAEPTPCYIPKKLLHTWAGHKKGVSAIQFFPVFGHLILSGSMDSTCKIWSVNQDRKCLRTFFGHTEAVRAIDFNFNGSRFISASYDRFLKEWDTETGQCVSKCTSKKVPFCAKYHPSEQRCNEVLVGQSDKKIVQWDLRSGEIVQRYEEHLGPVNSICFVDEGRKFFSTSDDKKVFCWEYGIPVVSKHIAEPDMQSMPATALHPNGQWWVGQSQDNQILVYGAIRKVSLNTKKRYIGHLTTGYACQVGFSPDGRYLYSGDAEGRCFFWDWKTSKLHKKLKCHDQVTIGCQWHPIESSKFATCSWDGTIKYWD